MRSADAEILTVDDLAKLFACDKETAAARLTSGDLPGVKVGRGWIIPRNALFERLNEKAREEAAIRRTQQVAIFDEGQRRGKSLKTAPHSLPLADLSTATGATKKIGRRRTPPPLPTLIAMANEKTVK